jgi:hypothetical protein
VGAFAFVRDMTRSSGGRRPIGAIILSVSSRKEYTCRAELPVYASPLSMQPYWTKMSDRKTFHINIYIYSCECVRTKVKYSETTSNCSFAAGEKSNLRSEGV